MGKKILLADDSIVIRKITQLAFSETDYEVLTTGDGESALKMIHESKPDVVFLDVVMPKMNGYELSAKLRSDPMTKDIPIILISASSEVFDETRAKEIRVNDVITKPFNSSELIVKVNSVLSKDHKQEGFSPESTVEKPVETTQTPVEKPVTISESSAPTPSLEKNISPDNDPFSDTLKTQAQDQDTTTREVKTESVPTPGSETPTVSKTVEIPSIDKTQSPEQVKEEAPVKDVPISDGKEQELSEEPVFEEPVSEKDSGTGSQVKDKGDERTQEFESAAQLSEEFQAPDFEPGEKPDEEEFQVPEETPSQQEQVPDSTPTPATQPPKPSPTPVMEETTKVSEDTISKPANKNMTKGEVRVFFPSEIPSLFPSILMIEWKTVFSDVRVSGDSLTILVEHEGFAIEGEPAKNFWISTKEGEITRKYFKLLPNSVGKREIIVGIWYHGSKIATIPLNCEVKSSFNNLSYVQGLEPVTLELNQ